MVVANEIVLRKAWLEVWDVETLAFALSTRYVIPVAEGKQTSSTLFILDKPILANTHLLCFPYIVCSFFFHQYLSNGNFL